ncbi:MAG TPA: PA14 domain-containing protein, partial [Phycisphaerae bacterium]|nr:PA14 domain-containing protein [Phycisphaerae bacterium]
HLKFLGHLPMLFARKAETVAVIGLGAGITTGAVLLHPDVRRVDVFEAGTTIPKTFSTRVGNTGGFVWYVSRHFALKSDLERDQAHQYLHLLEMAWPHYVELLDGEPPGMDAKRLAVVYASSEAQLRKALAGDAIIWNFDGGGITFEGVFASYVFPSGSLHYHQRYILLHECTHLFQQCLTGQMMELPEWYYEGLADSLASHVYDPAARRLTVHVLDKPTTADFFDLGLREHARRPRSFQQLVHARQVDRGLQFLMVHFLRDDPYRRQMFRIWRDTLQAMPAAGDRIERGRALLAELLGGWDKLNSDFAAFLARRNTFHYAEWGWEQEGDTMWSYGFAADGKLSRTDVYLSPGEPAVYHPQRMDYPMQDAPPPVVGEVRRGGDRPAVGAVLDFSRSPGKGQAGIGMGLVDVLPPTELDGRVFLDAEARKPGLKLTAWRLQGFAVTSRLAAEDFLAGRKLGEGVASAPRVDPLPDAFDGRQSMLVAQWEGFVRVEEEGEHTFCLTSDDGSWLWVAGQSVINNGGMHQARAAEGKIALKPGLHPLRLRYVQGGGEMALEVTMRPPGQPGWLQILVDSQSRLLVDGGDLGIQPVSLDLPAAFRSPADGRIGLNARIDRMALVVTLRARRPHARSAPAATPKGGSSSPDRLAEKSQAEFTAEIPISDAARRRLLERPLTVLSRGGWHGITPYFDDARRQEADLNVPAPANRWRNPGDRALLALCRAAHILGSHAPRRLVALRTELLDAATASPDRQRQALDNFRSTTTSLRLEIRTCNATADQIDQAVKAVNAALAGPTPALP